MRRLTGAILLALTLVLIVDAAPAVAFDRVANEKTMLRLINNARVARGLARVRVASPLHSAALAHSRDMIARDYFAHSSLDGATIAARARRAGYTTSGWSRWSVGEVIAWGTSSRGAPRSIFRAWMRSYSHRKIILAKNWRDVGIGCARGNYKGFPGVIMYTVDFGRRVP
jgi:uncharacterized protein YkwD